MKNVKKYLDVKGWTQSNVDDDLSIIGNTYNNERITIMIPRHENFLDYEYRMNELVKALSVLESRDIKEVKEDIEGIGFDVMKIRLVAPKTQKGTIPLSDFEKIVDNIKDIIKFEACSEIRPESQYRHGFKEATKLIEKCEVGQTQEGSFVVIVKVPSHEISFEKEDLGRRSIKRLIEGIEEAKVLSLENEEQFRTSYNRKLNKNSCQAISGLMESQYGYDVEIKTRWDVQTPIPETVPNKSEIKSGEHFQRFNLMSSYLEKIPESETTEIGGFIRILKDENIDVPGQKRLIVVEDRSKRKSVYVWLEPEDYLLACDAYKLTKRIKISGYLNKRDKHWVLDTPQEFQVIEATEQTE